LSLSGCKSSKVIEDNSSINSISEYSEILINTDLLNSISIHDVYDEELVKIPVKEEWAFLSKYTNNGTLPKEENHKLLAYPDTHIIHLNMISDEGDEVVYEKVYLFNDGSIAKQEMCGDSGVTDKTYDVYKAEEKLFKHL
jgi:Ribonuclease G/E